ncbi:hypothetical protein CDAR_33391 [Caerostris darwini]|uniref:Uncharacterized protein n=1 Tax=Caerostris darwini TaxID=1538125 RepID=A0AAV4VDB8_9ARAC|nr:hypothetical protein CDAR_33391 [Caerostris darwini]
MVPESENEAQKAIEKDKRGHQAGRFTVFRKQSVIGRHARIGVQQRRQLAGAGRGRGGRGRPVRKHFSQKGRLKAKSHPPPTDEKLSNCLTPVPEIYRW